MNLTFGPINSRRFGLSLGIDLSPEQKQCNFDCLYCELKGAKAVDKMINPPSVDSVVEEVKKSLKKFTKTEVVTITANGEPTLYPYMKELVNELNKIKEDKKILILSNASTIYDTNIQNSLLDIDIVKLSLDSVDTNTFKKVDRPHKSIELQNIIEGIKTFRKVFKNSLVIEVLVVENLNDSDIKFIKLNKILNEIKPDRVDISSIDRPSAYKVNPVSIERLENLSRYIENIPVSIAKRDKEVKAFHNLDKDEILSLLDKRPQSEDDVKTLFSVSSQEKFKNLLDEKKIKLINVANINFYKLN